METHEPTTRDVLTLVHEVLDTVHVFATNTDQRFNQIDVEIRDIKAQVAKTDSRLTKVESTMVTKDYLDDKLGDLKGDLILLARKQNRKFESLVDAMVMEGILPQAVADRLLALEPFVRV